jgi:hypothetical protein
MSGVGFDNISISPGYGSLKGVNSQKMEIPGFLSSNFNLISRTKLNRIRSLFEDMSKGVDVGQKEFEDLLDRKGLSTINNCYPRRTNKEGLDMVLVPFGGAPVLIVVAPHGMTEETLSSALFVKGLSLNIMFGSNTFNNYTKMKEITDGMKPALTTLLATLNEGA